MGKSIFMATPQNLLTTFLKITDPTQWGVGEILSLVALSVAIITLLYSIWSRRKQEAKIRQLEREIGAELYPISCSG